MKRALALILSTIMLFALIAAMPVSAAKESNYRDPKDIIEKESNYLRLTHKNVSEFEIEPGRNPGQMYSGQLYWTTGASNQRLEKNNCCFINVAKTGKHYELQTPGMVAWDITGGNYTNFQCKIGTFNPHGEGRPRTLEISVRNARGEEQVIAVSEPFRHENKPVEITAQIPRNTVTVIARLRTDNGNWASSNSVIIDAIVWGEYPDAEYQNPESILQNQKNVLRLTHSNVDIYLLEAGRNITPCPSYPGYENANWTTGVSKLPIEKDNCCFINITRQKTSNHELYPGVIIWDIEDGNYTNFQCKVGSFFLYGDGVDRQITICALDENFVVTELEITKLFNHASAPIEISCVIPEGTKYLLAALTTPSGEATNANSVIIDAMVWGKYASTPTTPGGSESESAPSDETHPAQNEGGCGSALGAPALILAVTAVLPVLVGRKKKR